MFSFTFILCKYRDPVLSTWKISKFDNLDLFVYRYESADRAFVCQD